MSPIKLNVTSDSLFMTIEKMIQNLKEKESFLFRESAVENTLILGIARGGLIPAQYLAYAMDNRNLEIISSRLYDNMTINADNHSISGLEKINLNDYKNVIIVDDIYDTGTTIERITNKIKEEAPEINIIRTVCFTQQPNVGNVYYGEALNGEWVIFPWDVMQGKFLDKEEDEIN